MSIEELRNQGEAYMQQEHYNQHFLNPEYYPQYQEYNYPQPVDYT